MDIRVKVLKSSQSWSDHHFRINLNKRKGEQTNNIFEKLLKLQFRVELIFSCELQESISRL